MEKLTFITDENEEVEFTVVADTRVGGVNYLLVSDEDSEEAEAYILKDISEESDPDGKYVMVSDDDEFNAVASIFSDDLDDVEFK